MLRAVSLACCLHFIRSCREYSKGALTAFPLVRLPNRTITHRCPGSFEPGHQCYIGLFARKNTSRGPTEQYGWRVGYRFVGILSFLIMGPILLFVLRGSPEEKGLKAYGAEEQPMEEAAVNKSREKLDRHGILLMTCLILMAVCVSCGSCFQSHLTKYGITIGMSLQASALLPSAAMLGIIGGDPKRELAVLESVREEHRVQVEEFLKTGNCTVSLIAGDDNLHIIMELFSGDDCSLVEIKGTHQHVIRIERNGAETFAQSEFSSTKIDKSMLNLRDIVTFADEVCLEDVQDIIQRQIAYNCAICAEGLANPYGAQIGRLLMSRNSGDIQVRAKATAAAGSDARMNGCTMPVVINSGSGNQGITVCVPVVEYAQYLNSSEEKAVTGFFAQDLG